MANHFNIGTSRPESVEVKTDSGNTPIYAVWTSQKTTAGVWGKRSTLYINLNNYSSYDDIVITINRVSSPNEDDTLGELSNGSYIYYGDVLEVTLTERYFSKYSLSWNCCNVSDDLRRLTKSDFQLDSSTDAHFISTYKIVVGIKDVTITFNQYNYRVWKTIFTCPSTNKMFWYVSMFYGDSSNTQSAGSNITNLDTSVINTSNYKVFVSNPGIIVKTSLYIRYYDNILGTGQYIESTETTYQLNTHDHVNESSMFSVPQITKYGSDNLQVSFYEKYYQYMKGASNKCWITQLQALIKV